MNPELLAFIAGALTAGSVVIFLAYCWTSNLRSQIRELEDTIEAAWSVAGYWKEGHENESS